MSCNFVIHVACPLELTVYKYNELQVFVVIQKSNCARLIAKHPFFIVEGIVNILKH
jgi:hypothetical protein